MVGIYYILVFLFGVSLGGAVVYHKLARSKVDGVLIVTDVTEDKTRWTLNVNTDPEEIPKKKWIRLQVHVQK